MEIRKIHPEETWALRQRVMWPTETIEFVKLKDDSQGIHYGLFVADNLVSVISLFYQEEKVQFRKFATCTKEQGRGYGTQLLQHIITEAASMGAKEIWCYARSNKVCFYEKFGFIERGEPFVRNGKDYIVMSRNLISERL